MIAKASGGILEKQRGRNAEPDFQTLNQSFQLLRLSCIDPLDVAPDIIDYRLPRHDDKLTP